MIVTEDIFVMLLTEAKFKMFTPKEICDSTKSTEVLVCLSSESREKIDALHAGIPDDLIITDVFEAVP